MLSEQSTWKGPYLLTRQMVEKLIGHDGPGMYVLGSSAKGRKFEMKHVGSSASLRDKLKTFLGKYEMFMYDVFEPLQGTFTEQHVPADHEIKVNKISDRD